jgi:hypothetical protein
VSKRTAVVLRSGYPVESRRDPHAVLDHLTSAILGESVVRAREEGVKSWDDVVREIDAEIGHVRPPPARAPPPCRGCSDW